MSKTNKTQNNFNIKNINIDNINDVIITNNSANRPYGRRFKVEYNNQSCTLVFKKILGRIQKIAKKENNFENLRKIQEILKKLKALENDSIKEDHGILYRIRTCFHKIGDIFCKSHLERISSLERNIQDKIKGLDVDTLLIEINVDGLIDKDEPKPTQDSYLTHMVNHYLKDGNLDHAAKAIKKISCRKLQERPLLRLGEAYCKKGDLAKALETVVDLPRIMKVSLIQDIARGYIVQGDIDRALEVAIDNQVDEFSIDDFLKEIGKAYLAKGMINKAGLVEEMITDTKIQRALNLLISTQVNSLK